MTRVLIVDDSKVILRELETFFTTEMGMEVVGTGSDGITGVALYRQHHPDLVTMDLTMPNKDGIEALREILTIDPAARVIVISAMRDKDKILFALSQGAKAFIKKPLLLANRDFVQQIKEDIARTLAA